LYAPHLIHYAYFVTFDIQTQAFAFNLDVSWKFCRSVAQAGVGGRDRAAAEEFPRNIRGSPGLIYLAEKQGSRLTAAVVSDQWQVISFLKAAISLQ
jgi:hypothetical protein